VYDKLLKPPIIILNNTVFITKNVTRMIPVTTRPLTLAAFQALKFHKVEKILFKPNTYLSLYFRTDVQNTWTLDGACLNLISIFHPSSSTIFRAVICAQYFLYDLL